VSLAALGPAEANKEGYYWEDLNATDLADSTAAAQTGRTATGKADAEVATVAALDLSYLAGAADLPADHPDIVRTSLELAEALKIEVKAARESLRVLLAAHKSEWKGFLAALNQSSWLVQLVQED
jgi:hypothetical protein